MINKIELIAQANGDNPIEFSKRIERYILENRIKAKLGKQITKTDNCMISKNIIPNPSGNNYKIKITGKIPDLEIIDYISETNKVTDYVF